MAFTTAAFGFAEQVSIGLEDPTEAISTLPAGSVLISPRSDDMTAATAIDESVLDTVRATEGVLTANGLFDQPVSFALRADQQPERPVQLRGLVLSSVYDDSRWQLLEGRAPVRADEVAVDPGGAVVGQAPLGSRARLELPVGSREVTVVGMVTTRRADRTVLDPTSPATGFTEGTSGDSPTTPPSRAAELAEVAVSSAHVVLPAHHAAEMLAAVGKLDRISAIPEPGVPPDALARRIRSEVSEGLAVMAVSDRAQATQDTVAALDDGVSTALVAFAVVTVGVAGLAVANIYTVLLAQRTRELALLRLVGARRSQVISLVLREACIAGLAGTVLGLAGGAQLARIAVAVVRPLGVEPAVRISWSMVAAASVVGGLVALGGAIMPAVRASRHGPLEAMSDTAAGGDRPVRGSRVAALMIAGIVWLGFAQVPPTNRGPIALGATATGVVLLLAALVLASRWFVGPLCAVASRPMNALFGHTARLGVGNVARSPNRAAAAASTLLITMVLVGAVATFGSGVRQGVTEQFATTGRADLFVERRGLVRVDTRSLFEAFGDRLAPVRSGAAIVSVDGVLIGPSGSEARVVTSDLRRLADMVDLGIVGGSVSDDADAAMLSETSAAALGADVGDRIRLRSTSGREAPVKVVALYRNSAFVGPAVLAWGPVSETGSEGTFELAALDVSPCASVHATRTRLLRVADGFPRVRVHTPGEFEELDASVVDTVLRIVSALLSASVGIGVLGLGSTLALSVHERRREIVMLRAVGASRPQIRSIVGTEAVLISALAAIAGLAGGAGGAWLAIRTGVDTPAVNAPLPWGLLLGVAIIAVCIGWIVGIYVARRAARMPPAGAGAPD